MDVAHARYVGRTSLCRDEFDHESLVYQVCHGSK